MESELGKGTRVIINMNALFPKPKQPPEGTTPDLKLFDSIKAAELQRFHVYRPRERANDRHPDRAIAVLDSVRSVASQWLPCVTRSSSSPDFDEGANVCAITEADLVWLAENDARQYNSLLSELAAKGAVALILAPSLRSVASSLSFDDAPTTPVFVPQA